MSNPELAQQQALAEAFASYFYQMFQSNREELANLFIDSSTMTFEGQFLKGREQIMQKLLSLPKNIQRVLTTADCQPIDDTFSLVFLIGQLRSDNDPAHSFAETFLLKNINGQFFVMNSFFRLVLHNS